MRKNIESLINLCNPGSEGTMKEAIKKAIREEVVAANDTYVKKLQTQRLF